MKSRLVAVTALGFVTLAVLLVLLAGGAPSTAAQAPNPFQPFVSRDIAHDTSAPLRELSAQYAAAAPASPLASDAINRMLPNRALSPDFVLKLKEEGIDVFQYIQSQQTGDNIVQHQTGVPYAPNNMPPTLLNWMGLWNIDGYYPPDTEGDIGYDPVTQKKFYMEWVNVRYAIWDVTTTPVMVLTPTLGNVMWSGFPGTCATQNDGDPIVIFDQLANRWLISQFSLPNYPSGPFYQCIAISQSADPTGAWYRYEFQVSATKMNDYPKFGVWPDAYYMSMNEFYGGSNGNAGAVAFERARMLQGLSAQMVLFDLTSVNSAFGGQLPSSWAGATPPPAGAPNYFYEVDDNVASPSLGADAMRIWKFHVDWTTPANSTFGVNGTPNYTLTVASWDALPCTLSSSRSCIPQLGTATQLDGIGDRLMYRAQYRNIYGHETVVLNHTVNAGSGRAGVRWYEVRDLGTAPFIYQQGTYAPSDGLYRWMGSLAMDHVGNIALGFSTSSGSTYPSIAYTGRLAGDPLGVMAQGETVIISGTGSQTGTGSRWGDYSTMSVDPQDDCTFFYTQEYLTTTGTAPWTTQIASFKFPNCSLGPQGTLTGTVTNASNSNPITGAKVDATLSPTQTFTAYSNPSGNYNLVLPVGTYTVTGAAYGYLPATFSGVSVVSGTTTTRMIPLTPAATYVISGFVKDSVTNNPLWATVAVIGTPFNPPFSSVQTDPATGFYSMTVSGGQSYTLTASALLHTPLAQGVTPVGNQTVNFNLVATTTNGGIVGWVKNYYTGDPIPGATVTVNTGGNPNDTTDANGYFEIFGLTPGFYTATASANLYSPVSISNIQVLQSNVAIRTFNLPTSRLVFAPASLQKTVTFGQVVTDVAGLVISNTGIGALSFGLIEQPGGFTPSRPHQSNGGGPDPFGYTWVTSAEAGGPSYNWIDATGGTALGLGDDDEANITLPFSFPYYTSTTTLMRVGNNGAALYNATSGDVGVTNYPMTDTLTPNYFIAPFWDDIDSDTGNVYWMVTGSVPNRQLVVEWYNRPHFSNVGSATFEMVLFENGDILYQYQDVNFGDATLNNGASATVGIRGPNATYSLQSSYNTASLQDNFAICFDNPNNAGACGGSGYDAIPWLTEAPLTGTLTQSNTQNIQLAWNANNAQVTQPGKYTGTLKIANNDPTAQNATAPVVMTVLPVATQGLLNGVVSTSGVCDVNLAPINGAKVNIVGSGGFTQTLTTNASGGYSYYVDATQNPFTVTVTAVDHLATSVGGVTVTGGFTTTQNFTLRLQKPCINVDPKALQATLQFGASTSQTLYVTSTGALPLDFNLYEAPSSGGLAANAPRDAFGYAWITATYNWIDATGGTALGLADDGEANVTSPFAFPYYGGSATALRVGNNGATLFNVTTGDVAITNNPMATAPDNFIAAFWDDIDSDTGDVYWQVIGSAPNRKLVIEWYNRPHYSNVGSATFEMVLYENGNILYQYQDVDFGDAAYNSGASATVGIRGVGAANSVEYSYNQPKLSANQAICFTRPGNAACGAVDVPWLSESITSTVGLTGTPPASQMINVTFDASQVVLPGDYTTDLVFAHNSPQPDVHIPVTMTVLGPASFGQIKGVVNGLAACDLPGAPLQGAAVQVTGGTAVTLTTNAGGQYNYWLPGNAGTPYTLTVSYAGYVPQTAHITVTQGTTTTTNFNLRLLAPCASATPASLSATARPNLSALRTITLTNSGLAALTFQVKEQPATLLNAVTLQLPAMPAVSDAAAKFNAANAQPVDSHTFTFDPGYTRLAPNVVKVLLLTPDVAAGGSIGLIQSTLAAYPDLQVTLWNGASGDPTAAQLAPYNVVVVGNDYLWNATGSTMTAAGVGNALADYIDAGGKVIDICFVHSYDAWALAGRYITGGYSPVTVATSDHTAIPYTLGTVFDASHPIMAGVTTISDNPTTIGIGHQDVGLAAGATRLANWNDGDIFIAYKTNTVAVNQNWFHGSGWTGDVGKVMHNSILWLGGGGPSMDIPWLTESPITGTVAAGSQQLINVTFTAAPTMTLGVYTGTLVIDTNDLSHATFNVPVSFQVISGKLYLPLIRK